MKYKYLYIVLGSASLGLLMILAKVRQVKLAIKQELNSDGLDERMVQDCTG
ncbi:hypothetical protein LCGC14_1908400 [marine sediment metagenome]|uniref:Uncharacterized protein n=1 Tax=marine sediment metagenome TaxID=412755 RepID=A0A0F9FUW9_9ZZZZ